MINFYSSTGNDGVLVRESLDRFRREKVIAKLWSKDPSLWKSDLETQRKIGARLGWLAIPETMKSQIPSLNEFGKSLLKEGFKDIVLIGMGGSSLCPEVFRKTYGVAPGYPQFHVLDTTDPSTILHLKKGLQLEKTLFILASKSGSTIEVESLYLYFLKKIEASHSTLPGDHFIAITDPGSPMEKVAREKKFRNLFLSPSDIGGRFSALSYFGLVPAALMGINLDLLLSRATEMAQKCRSEISVETNPALQLGAVLASLGGAGRNKITLILPEPIQSFGVWLEQLLAESTGKEGKGLVPVEGEPAGKPECYGDDRLFVYYRLKSNPDSELDHKIDLLERSGHPVVRVTIQDLYDLAGEFFRWEMATAIVGIPWSINPFDEPNVKESKENTQRILEIFKTSGRLPDSKISLKENGVTLYGETALIDNISLAEILKQFLSEIPLSHYVALMAYLESSGVHEALLQKMRIMIRDRYRLATTLGYGPRFLHSTGQLHKGGKREGAFIQMTADHPEDCFIPGRNYSFGILNRAQSLGDLDSIKKRGLPVLQLHLGHSPEDGLKYIIGELERVLK